MAGNPPIATEPRPGQRTLECLGLIEVKSWTASIAALDAVEKAADVRLIDVELNDLLGACIKIAGDTAAVQAAVAAGREQADRMKADCVTDVIPAPDASALRSALQQPPNIGTANEDDMADSTQTPYAIGIIETQGLTAVIEAIDTACKAASVEVIGKEKLGGGYIAVLIKGDVAAVRAAVDAGRQKVEGLGKLIAAHVIPRPTQSVLKLVQQL